MQFQNKTKKPVESDVKAILDLSHKISKINQKGMLNGEDSGSKEREEVQQRSKSPKPNSNLIKSDLK